MPSQYHSKKNCKEIMTSVVVIDIEGTLTSNEQPLTNDMRDALLELLSLDSITTVALIAGDNKVHNALNQINLLPDSGNVYKLWILSNKPSEMVWTFEGGSWNRSRLDFNIVGTEYVRSLLNCSIAAHRQAWEFSMVVMNPNLGNIEYILTKRTARNHWRYQIWCKEF